MASTGVPQLIGWPKVLSAKFPPGPMSVPATPAIIPSLGPYLTTLGATAFRLLPYGFTRLDRADARVRRPRQLRLTTDGGSITRATEFDTMARFRCDSGKGLRHAVRPQPVMPNKADNVDVLDHGRTQ
jgi:hypothetical protein